MKALACYRLPSLWFLLVICDSGGLTWYGNQRAHGMACSGIAETWYGMSSPGKVWRFAQLPTRE